MNPTPPVLAAHGLAKRFGRDHLAVDDVSLEVMPGEVVGVVGESGSGKTTTGLMLLGLVTPDSGEVRFEGRRLADLRSRELRRVRARLQVVPQNPQTSLNPRMTVRSSIEFNLRAHRIGASAAERRERVLQLLERVGLDGGYAERYPHQLSGGQMQRVAIARALATGPTLVVCDEAVSALDKSVQAQVLNLIADLRAREGVAFLFISHDLSVVEHISDRVIVMHRGRIVETGSAAQVWASPAHPYTAALLAATPGASLWST